MNFCAALAGFSSNPLYTDHMTGYIVQAIGVGRFRIMGGGGKV